MFLSVFVVDVCPLQDEINSTIDSVEKIEILNFVSDFLFFFIFTLG
jgi:hypothetical protein